MKPAAGKVFALTLSLAAAGWAMLCAAPSTFAAAAPPGTAPSATQATAASTPAPATTPRVAVRDLLAWGTDDRFWSADVIPFIQGKQTTNKTFFRARGPGDAQWKLIAELEAQAVSLSNRGGELLVALEGGDWKIVADDGARSGSPLPGGAQVVALAGEGDDVWAVGVAPPGQNIVIPPAKPAATTSTTTTPAPATTQSVPAQPATRPHALGLFLLSRGDWTERDVLPPDVGRDDTRAVSLAVLDRRLMLAVADSDGAIRIYAHKSPVGWDLVGGADVTVAPAGQPRLRLLDLRGRPALWVAGTDGPGSLYVLNADTDSGGSRDRWQPTRIQPAPTLQKFDRTALATALGQLRLLASDGKQRLAEQNYNADGTLAGVATEAVTAPQRPLDDRTAQLFMTFLGAIVLMWAMSAMRQRPDAREAARRARQLNLAPVGVRLLAGAIDLLPVLLAAYLAARYSISDTGPASVGVGPAAGVVGVVEPKPFDSPRVALIAAGLGLYLLHTTVLELLFAKSLGKFATGLRVASLDGSRPTPRAVLTRNLLRPVDLVLTPLFLTVSPLRQRIGDMAAGTIVVRSGPIDPTALPTDEAAAADRDAAPPPPAQPSS